MDRVVGNRFNLAGADKRIQSFLIVSLILGIIGAVITFFFIRNMQSVHAQVQSGAFFIAFDELSSKVFFLTSTFLLGLMAVGLEVFVRDIKRREKNRFEKMMLKALAFLVVVSIPGSFVAGFLYDHARHSELYAEGYYKCDNNVFLLSKSFTESAWVLDRAWCQDPQVRHILVSKHSKSGFAEVNAYLERMYSKP